MKLKINLIKRIVLLIALSGNLFGQTESITFLNPVTNKRLRIDLENQFLLEEVKANQWISQSRLEFINIDRKQILSVYKFNTFKRKSDFIITVPGTGQVYLLKLNDWTFKRVDKSFHTGYNFQAVQFVRKDTLFSFGGYGFWQYQNVLSYFDPKSLEWETYAQLEEGPERFTNRFSCYSANSDKVFALELPKPYLFSKTKKYTYWEFSFSTKKWNEIGQINERLATQLPETKTVGHYFFFKYQNLNLIADPEKNQVFVYEGPHTKLTDALDQEPAFYNLGKIYSYQKFLIGNVENYHIDSCSADTLLIQSKLQFELIEPSEIEPKNIGFGIILIAILIILCIVFMWVKKKNSQAHTLINYDIFSLTELEILNKMLNKGIEYEFNSDQLNFLLDSEKKPVETQRQIRSRFISSLNHKVELHFQIKEAICRRKSSLDKRFTIYVLNDEFYKTLFQLDQFKA